MLRRSGTGDLFKLQALLSSFISLNPSALRAIAMNFSSSPFLNSMPATALISFSSNAFTH
jgi:hypothetical protein